jgi:bla regulator protein blaR1
MTLYLANLVAYSLQLAALAATAYVTVWALRLRTPRVSIRFWQGVTLIALALPALQPWRRDEVQGLIATISSVSTASAPRAALATTTAFDAVTIILAVLAAGAIARLLWLALGVWRVRSLIANATPAPALGFPIGELNQQIGVDATLMVSDELAGPATVGWRRPVVLLPRAVLTMPQAVQRAVVCHELVHVKRRDWLQTIAEEIWCALLWFHPAARVIASRLSLARETVVDEMTILLTRDRRAYAEALLAFADPQPHLIGVTPFIGRHTLSQRISLIAQEGAMSSRRALMSVAFAFVASVGLTAAAVDRFPMSTSPAQAEKVYKLGPGSGVSLPWVLHEVKPGYTAAAMQKKIQGSVWLEAVVTTKGDVGDVKVTRSLDAEYGLDQKAIAALKQWKFKPGTRQGKPVPVLVTIELTFTLK